MSFRTIALTVACCLPVTLTVSTGQEEKPARHARFLPVGDAPPFLQEIRDGVRYEIDPPPDSIPPREVVPGFGEEFAEAVDLRLGRISAPVKAPAGEGPLALRRTGATPLVKPWLNFKLPESGDLLVFLWRNPAKGSWKNALSLVVPDGPLGHPAGSVRIVNLFPQAARIVWGRETLLLPRGGTILRTVRPGAEVPFQILVADASGGMKRYYSGAVIQNQGERGFITIYRADGVSPRRPLKVSMLREPVPAVAPPPGDGEKR